MRSSVLVRFAAIGCLALTSCAAGAEGGPAVGQAAAGGAEQRQEQLVTLLSYEIEAPADRAGVLKAYAEGTGVEIRADGAVVRAGPLQSLYEASFVAGLVPGAKAAMRDRYEEPATPEPWRRMRQEEPRTPEYVTTRRLLGERFALVVWALEDDKKERELYQTHASGPRLLAKLPGETTLETSSGMLASRVGDEVTFLQVMNERRDDAIKAERLIAWRWGFDKREVLFDKPLLSFKVPDEGEPEITVLRVRPASSGVVLTAYRVRLKKLPAANDVSLALNDWSSEAWKGKSPLPDLVEITAVEKVSETSTSLE
jgi:hypothetical protein